MGGKRRTDISDAEIRRLYWEESKTPAEIGVIFSVSPNTIITRMRRAGIPRRSKLEGIRLSARWSGRKWTPPTESELKNVLRCRQCGWVWQREGDRIHVVCPRCGESKDARRRQSKGSLEKLLAWKKANPGQSTLSTRRMRRSALLRVGRGSLACAHCGCDRVDVLEINHINGSGAVEIRSTVGGAAGFYRDIALMRRPVDDLEIRCKVCNALHYLELKYGPLPYEIRYRREGATDGSNDSDG